MSAVALARSAEKLVDQLLDDLPLRGIGVLRFVDEDMIDLAVELVAHPVAHSGLAKQAPRPVDQIVEVGDARRALGLGIGCGERLARPQPGRNVGSEPRSVLKAQQYRR